MFQAFIQSVVRGEVTVGIVLTLLLVSGRNDPHTLAYSLAGIGFFLLLQGLVPLSSRAPRRTPLPRKASTSPIPHGDAESQAVECHQKDATETTVSPCACAKRPFNRREYFVRAAVSSLVVLATACLIYWFAPSII